jgi:CRP-like cAMP-binding protein
MPAVHSVPTVNKLLAALPRGELERLLRCLEPVALTSGEVLNQPGEPIRHVYFPGDCLVSLLAVAEERTMLEVGMIGREGMVGISLALGMDVSPLRALVQKSGTAMRIDSKRFGREFSRNPSLRRHLLRYTHTLMTQATQAAVCSHSHLLEARLARLLLTTRDRMPSSDFHLTHEFLAKMLGVRRVGVTKAAGALQRRKLLSYRRGNIRILDRAGLEAASCRCYQIVKSLHDHALDGLARRKPAETAMIA